MIFDTVINEGREKPQLQFYITGHWLVTDWSLLVMSDEEEIEEIKIEKPTAKAKVKVLSLVYKDI